MEGRRAGRGCQWSQGSPGVVVLRWCESRKVRLSPLRGSEQGFFLHEKEACFSKDFSKKSHAAQFRRGFLCHADSTRPFPACYALRLPLQALPVAGRATGQAQSTRVSLLDHPAPSVLPQEGSASSNIAACLRSYLPRCRLVERVLLLLLLLLLPSCSFFGAPYSF